MTSREQIFAIGRDLKWIAAISLFISALLLVPDQVYELYRLSAADGNWVMVKELSAVTFMGLAIWFGALLIAAESAKLIGSLLSTPAFLLRWIPIVLGVLPIGAAAVAQWKAMPSTAKWTAEEAASLREVGSVFRIQEQALHDDIVVLWISLGAFIAIGLLLILVGWHYGKKFSPFLVKIDEGYFLRLPFLLTSVATIVFFTTLFVAWPDVPAQAIGTFGVVAVFTLCITAFCVHISLLTISRKLPLFPIIFGFALLIGVAGIDNHRIRTLDRPQDYRASAGQAFVKWLSQPDRLLASGASDEYPVFIVTAQGGGIYAAHNAALFLARMQDLCPAFRRHLFAISSVSGGSVGAATFAAALSTTDERAASRSASTTTSMTSCDDIARFIANLPVKNLGAPGQMEEFVDRILKNDFLSPLAAAALFPDFTQFFLPFPVGAFDRARSLEYTFENATEVNNTQADSSSATNLLQADYQEHWTPENGMPALLMNTTDAGSGKRVLVAPFDLDPMHPKDAPICMLASVQRSSDGKEVISSRSLHFPLSTAAFMSARFPWVSPAATVSVANDCITHQTDARLVDGGYIDNSGVETALDLVGVIKTAAEAVSKIDPGSIPKFRIYLISLSGGDFPDHGSFSFGDLLEPIRALLNGRSSRAYIALNRASTTMKNSDPPVRIDADPRFDSFSKTALTNYFYELPLGWAMSDKTRDVVSFSSGRYWDCDASATFSQRRELLSNADCIQMKIYYLLDGTVKSAFREMKEQNEISAAIDQKIITVADQWINHEALLACYEEKWFHDHRYKAYQISLKKFEDTKNLKNSQPPQFRKQNLAYYQAEHVRALLNEWDTMKEKESEWKVLAYLLGSISYDTSEFTRTTENLSFRSAKQIGRIWEKQINRINAYNASQNPKLPPVDITSLVNNPTGLANTVWGWTKNIYGNKQPNDGWDFRPRGIYEIIGREQYDHENTLLKIYYPGLKIDILNEPNSVSNRKMSAKIAFSHLYHQKYPLAGNKTIAELLKATENDWSNPNSVWKKIRSFQKDMDQSNAALNEISERSSMFADCIDGIRNPKPTAFSWQRISSFWGMLKTKFGKLF